MKGGSVFVVITLEKLEMSASSGYQDLRCRQTITTHQERVLFIEHAVGDVAPSSTSI